MFSSLGFFKQVACPERFQCSLPGCIFSHQLTHLQKAHLTSSKSPKSSHELNSNQENDEVDCTDRPSKRRRLDTHSQPEGTPETHTSEESNVTPPVTDSTKLDDISNRYDKGEREEIKVSLPASAVKDVSPPPFKNGTPGQKRFEEDEEALLKNSKPAAQSKVAQPAPKKELSEALNPRMLRTPPTTHAIRLKMVMMLHEYMVRLNNEVKNNNDPSKNALTLSDQEVITSVLDEEERVAKENPSVYSNVIKLRIVALKKMKAEDWKKERLKQIAKDYPDDKPPDKVNPSIKISSGLSSNEEIALLPKLVAQQEGLMKHGYVTSTPTDTEISQARKGVEASHGWELCDRCKSRFQVFPGRAEDGSLTTGGACSYHYARPFRPNRGKGDMGPKESIYPCCNEPIGSSVGCTRAETHVFKISDPKRLAMVMPFEKTPSRAHAKKEAAVCFDCEMGYTTMGMELIRLTATSWPSGGQLLDVLVRPIGEVLDLNSRYSGVLPKHYANARIYSPGDQGREDHSAVGEVAEPRLPLVESPQRARELLFRFLGPKTPLMGHALENDLNAVRIIHPTIVDTVLLYPHPRGLPVRYGLKFLMKKHLDRDIQGGGAQGHDSKEDARAAGDLVRLNIAETWKAMLKEGWTVDDGIFYPPPAPKSPTLKLRTKLPESDGAESKQL